MMEATPILIPMALVLVAALAVVLVATALRRQALGHAADLPEALKLFAPTSRTVGGPGNYSGPREDLTIFRGNAHHVIAATIENMGKCPLWVELSSTQDLQGLAVIISRIPAGATITVCGELFRRKQSLLTHDIVRVGRILGPPVPEQSPPVCRYRWRVDVIGRFRSSQWTDGKRHYSVT